MKAFVLIGVVALALAFPAAAASGINGINGSMPNRISMNVTVAKQTQGATFGEKVNAGLHAAGSALAQGASAIDIGCAAETCGILFPGGDGIRADLATLQLAPLEDADRKALQHWGDPHVDAKARSVGQGASLLGGAMPGAGIVSAAVSSIGAKPGGAVSSSYAAGRMAPAGAALPMRETAPGKIDVTQPLVDGDYELAVVVEKATSGLKDTLKTNVRLAAPAQVRIVLGFRVQGGVLRARHDTAKNSISNVR